MSPAHLPVLQIVVPLVAAPVCVLLRRPAAALGVALAAGWSSVAIAALLLVRVLDGGPISYEMGGWAAPWGIEYRIDLLSCYMLLFVSLVGAVVLTYAPSSLAREIPRDRRHLFLAAYLLCLTGLMGICATGDLFNVFVFLEISSLSSYTLIALGERRQALTAAFQYLVMGTIGATFILIGIGLLYMMTGTLNMADMAVRIGPVIETRTVLVAFAFFTVGVALKMALFPLHQWLPNAYTYAPSVVSAFLAGTATKVSVYVLVRFVFSVFGTDFTLLNRIFVPASILAALVCSTVAIFQRDVKRMLAYSSLAQIGYMVLGISLATVTGLTAGIVHMFNHALTKTALFLAMGCIVLRLGSTDIEAMRGIGRRMPWTMAAWALGGLGLIGIPATAGFVSKWYLLSALVDLGMWPAAVLVLVSSLLAVIYVFRVVEAAYFHEPGERVAQVSEAPLGMLAPIWLLVGATLFFGLSTSLTGGVAQRAAQALLGLAP